MHNIILDCDPGHDDAVAIMLAALNPNINLLGITVSSGNQTIDKTFYNARALAEYLELDVPVLKGCSCPLVRKVEVCAEIHGESGLDGVTFAPLKKPVLQTHAVNFMIDTILNSTKPITIVVTGPLTNVALALRLAPQIQEKIEKIVLMGGSYQMGNVTPASEFNILCDPEAAHIVLSAGISTYFVTLDVTRKVLCYPNIVERMRKINTRASKLFCDLMETFNHNQKKIFGYEGGPLHDPLTIASLIDENLLTFKHVHTEIDLSHGPSYGRTNCDLFNYLQKDKNSYVSVDVDVDRFWNIIEDSLRLDEEK